MCGITGIIGPQAVGAIERMTQTLTHRGPDDAGYHLHEEVALGHRRLSIIDLSGGAQPISNEDDNLWLICNGEIYNSPTLRDELEARGHRFKTATDVEVILHLYEEYGADCVRHLRGMFAFALWDQTNKSLLMARDHMGQKPLFFSRVGNTLLFGSEVKAILASGMVQQDIDMEGLWHYVAMRFIPDHYTLFAGIEKLQAGTTLKYQDGRLELNRYWDIDFTEKLTGPEDEIAEQLDELLRDTVRTHLLSDVRVGAFLSGGIDSSTISAMMAQEQKDPIPVFSIGVKEQSFNELPYARMAAKRYGMEAHERIVEADMIHLIPSMIHHMDEPSDPFGVGVYLVSQLASEHVKVVLAGDGGDENFAGYDRFVGQRLADFYSILPRWFRSTVMRRSISMIPESFGYKSWAQKARWMNEMSFYDRGERYQQSMSFLRFSPQSRDILFTDEAKNKIKDWDSSEKILRYFNSDNVNELVDRMLYTDLMTRMPDHLLVIADRMSMAHSLENRSPLVDYQLVEFAARIPGRMKLKGTKLKYILKKVAARYLPSELIHRPKQGFGFPIAQWMRTELRGLLLHLFKESRLVQAGVFNQAYMDQILMEHLSGKIDHNFRLWILLNLELWYRLYFESESVDSLRGYTDRLMSSAA